MWPSFNRALYLYVSTVYCLLHTSTKVVLQYCRTIVHTHTSSCDHFSTGRCVVNDNSLYTHKGSTVSSTSINIERSSTYMYMWFGRFSTGHCTALHVRQNNQHRCRWSKPAGHVCGQKQDVELLLTSTR